MTRKMYDSVDPNAIPTNAQIVAGYIDGTSYRWPESAWTRFPNSIKVRIARRVTTNDGHVLDVESGIPTVWPPSQAVVDWVIMRRKAGVEPTIYCNQLNDWSGIKKLFSNANVAQPQYWVARYNNVQDIPDGAVAKQYANPPLAGGHYDLSVVKDYWSGVDTVGDDDMGGEYTDGMLKHFADKTYPLFGYHIHAGDLLLNLEARSKKLEDIHIGDRLQILETRSKQLEEVVSVGFQEAVGRAVTEYFAAHPPTVTVDYAAIAKAVVDEASRRLEL